MSSSGAGGGPGGGEGGSGPTEHTGNTAMFAVFLLAIYSLGLFPYTLYRVCGAGADDTAVAVAAASKNKKARGGGGGPSLLARAVAALRDKRTLALLLAWAAWAALLFFAAQNAGDLAPFDPFSILGLEHDATDRDIKKAYRKLSLQYHPDKNPDPKAHAYFASHIAKAYASLTDPISRQNYEKYGHPDGPQGMNVGVALPEWMFTKDRKMAPLMLLGLVGGGVLLPMALAAWHLFNGQKYSGPNKIMNETYSYLWHSPFKVKEVQHLGRIPETLICAHEFIVRPFPPSQVPLVEELRALIAPRFPDMVAKSNKTFWGRKPGLVKAHLLVLVHMEGLGSQVPKALWDDYRYVISKCPLLAEEIHRISLYPREPLGCGWATPAISSVEAMQCVAQCMSPTVRKGQPVTKNGGPGDIAPLAQLPHMSVEGVKLLRRWRPRGGGLGGAIGGGGGSGGGAVAFADVAPTEGGKSSSSSKAAKREQQAREQAAAQQAAKEVTVRDLQALDDLSRSEALASAGLTPDQAEEAAAFLQALPELAVIVSPPEVDGEEGVCQGDPVRVRARVLLRRPAHSAPGFSLRGRAVRAWRQHPAGLDAPPREEGWYALLIWPQGNAVLASGPGPRVNLIEAERAALANPEAFAAAAAAMPRRAAANASPQMQGLANIIVTSGGPSAVAAAWTAKMERRRKAQEAAAAAAGGADAGAVAAAAAERPSSSGGGSKKQQLARARSAGNGSSADLAAAAAAAAADEHASLYEDAGQVLDFHFNSPPEGTYELLLLILSDAYVGADVAVPVRLTVTRPAQREAAAAAAAGAATAAAAAAAAGGAAKGGGGKKKAARAAAADDESELTTAVRGGEGGEDEEDDAAGGRGGGDDADDEDEDEDDDEDGDQHSYDSEETGSMETGPESDSGDADGESDGTSSE